MRSSSGPTEGSRAGFAQQVRWVLVLAFATVAASPALASEPHERLCSALMRSEPSSAAVTDALGRGASPYLPCSVTKTQMRLRPSGLALYLATGGAAALVPGWLGPRAWEEHEETIAVPPLILASDARSRSSVELLLEAGAPLVTLDGAVAVSIEQGRLDWAEVLAELGAERSVRLIPTALLAPEPLERLLTMGPQLERARLDWDSCGALLAKHPEALPSLLAAGLPVTALDGAFRAAIDGDRFDQAADLAELGAERSLSGIPLSVLGDQERMARLVALRPDLSGIILLGQHVLSAHTTNREVFPQLIRAGLDPLMLGQAALAHRRHDELRALILVGLDPGLAPSSQWGRSLLEQASETGDREAVELLIEHGARTRSGGRAIPTAVQGGTLELVELLVEHGTDEHGREEAWLQVVRSAASTGDLAMVELALQPGRAGGSATFDEAIRTSIELRHPELITALVTASADPVASANRGLVHACRQGHLTAIPTLIRSGADLEHRVDEHGSTVLHLVSSQWYARGPRMVEALLEGGAEVDSADRHGQTALHRAAQADLVEVSESLLRAGASTSARDGDGQTPLGLAVRDQAWATAAVLTEGGAPVERWMVEEALASPGDPATLTATLVAFAQHPEIAGPRFWRRQLRTARRNHRSSTVIDALEAALESSRAIRGPAAST